MIRLSRANIVWLTLYVATLAAIVGGLFLLRDRMQKNSWNAPRHQADWDTFRQEMAKQTGDDGPVKRRVPRSPKPPLMFWMEDFFPGTLVAACVFGTALFCMLMFAVHGTFFARGMPPNEADDE